MIQIYIAVFVIWILFGVLKEGQQPVEIEFTLTMTGVDAYSSLEIDIPVNVLSGLVFDIDKIEYMITPSPDPVAAGRLFQACQWTFNVQIAILGWDNSDVVAAVQKDYQASAALLHSGMELSELHVDTRGRANLIATSSLFLGIDTSNVTDVAIVQGRLIGSIVKLDQKALTQLVLSQL